MKDKEFKSKNKDTNFSKLQKADTILGWHNCALPAKMDTKKLQKTK